MSWFKDDKRKQDRRTSEQENKEGLEAERQEEERKQVQRREYFRVMYPIAASPEITNLSAKLIDISVKALRFELSVQDASKFGLAVDKKINMKLKFHDGQTLEIAGTILRRLEDQFGKAAFVCTFDKQIASEIITKEQAYLLKNFPDFCRKAFNF